MAKKKDEKKTVMVTGVANKWGEKVAAELVNNQHLRVLGVDTKQPQRSMPDLDFIQADIRNPLITELLQLEEVDTVVHLAFVEHPQHIEANFEQNVMGTMKFFGMCAKVGVRKIVLKSSTAVYGARPDNSIFLPESHPLNGSRKYGYNRHRIEIESFCNGFLRQVPDTALTILRFPGIIGPAIKTPMTRFLTAVRAPVLMGFNPLFQVIHEDDVAAALVHAVECDVSGVFNVAAEGTLNLKKLMALAGKIPIPVLHPLAYAGTSIAGARYAPLELDYLRYPWVADLEKMRTVLDFTPQHTADEALREFASTQRLSRYRPQALVRNYNLEQLRDTLKRRTRIRRRENDE